MLTMKMLKQLQIVFFLFISLVILFISCSKDEPVEVLSRGVISWQLQNMETSLKSTEVNDVSAVFISLKNSSGEYVYNMQALTLISFNGGYLTGNIELIEGEYTVEDFVVVNNSDSVVYLSPKQGSEFASFVDFPLPLAFTVSANEVSVVTVQVIPADLGDADQYGYAQFTFEVVDPGTVSLDSGLIAYYPFNGTADDSSGFGNNGTEFYSSNYVEGVIGLAKDFDGSNDYIELNSTFDGSNGLSFSFWVKSRGTNGTENHGTVISKYNMAGAGYRCFMVGTHGDKSRPDDNRLFGVFYPYRDIGTTSDIVVSNFTSIDTIPEAYNPEAYTIVNPMQLPLSEWAFCVINVTDTEMQAWINGMLTVKKQRDFSTYFDISTQAIVIGNNVFGSEGSNNHLDGVLDELRIYNRALTKSEIKLLYELR